MAGYCIVQVDTNDQELMTEYRKGVQATIEQFGGRFLVRGGAFETKEGAWARERVVVLEFPSVEKANEWYHSDVYAPLLDMRKRAGEANFIVVEGV